jgi:diphthine synthase
MGSLAFIGLGMYDEKGISLMGLERAKASELVLLEGYTNALPGLNIHLLESLLDKKIVAVDRKYVEDGRELLARAESSSVALLVAGDPFVATTHVDLRIRAAKRGIKVEVHHAPSIISVAPGETGLQNYKFGRSATITFAPPHSEVPYDALKQNRLSGLHTLFFLDLRSEEGRFMSVGEAIESLQLMEKRRGEGVIGNDLIMIGVARAGGPTQLIRAGRADEVRGIDFGKPPHSLIIPGRLHFMEAEALTLFSGLSKELAERNL